MEPLSRTQRRIFVSLMLAPIVILGSLFLIGLIYFLTFDPFATEPFDRGRWEAEYAMTHRYPLGMARAAQSLIKPGMSENEVLKLLGDGPVWGKLELAGIGARRASFSRFYYLGFGPVGCLNADDQNWLLVQFNADGKVLRADIDGH